MFDESSTKKAVPVVGLVVCNIEGAYLIDISVPTGGKAADTLAYVEGEAGLPLALCCGAISDNCPAAYREAKDLCKKCNGVPVGCAANGLALVEAHFCKFLKLGMSVVKRVSACLFAPSLARRRNRLELVLCDMFGPATARKFRLSHLSYSDTRWHSRVVAAQALSYYWPALYEFFDNELKNHSQGDLDSRLGTLVRQLRTPEARMQVWMISTLYWAGPVLRGLQGRYRMKASPAQTQLVKARVALWRAVVETPSLAHEFPPPWLADGREGDDALMNAAVDLYVKCVKAAVKEYDKLVKDGIDLIEIIQVFHPAYLARLDVTNGDPAALQKAVGLVDPRFRMLYDDWDSRERTRFQVEFRQYVMEFRNPA